MTGREATCKITTPHQHSSFDDPIDCPYTEGRQTTRSTPPFHCCSHCGCAPIDRRGHHIRCRQGCNDYQEDRRG